MTWKVSAYDDTLNPDKGKSQNTFWPLMLVAVTFCRNAQEDNFRLLMSPLEKNDISATMSLFSSLLHSTFAIAFGTSSSDVHRTSACIAGRVFIYSIMFLASNIPLIILMTEMP